MGCAGSNLNETMAFIQAARNETTNNKLDTLMSQRLEISTSQNMALQLEDMKLKAISEVIKNDRLEELIDMMKGGDLDLNEQFGQMRVSSLHIAAYFGSTKILRALLKTPGIDVNVANVDGDTPLMLAIISCDTDTVALKRTQIFLKSTPKVSISQKNSNMNFPLVAAIRNGFTETAKLLITPRLILAYHLDDITVAIKIALRLHADEIAEIIAENVGQDKLRGLLNQITYNTPLFELAQDMEKTIISNHKNKQRPSLPTFQRQQSAITILDPEKQIEDAAENQLKVGNVVQTLSTETIRRSLPPESRESDEVLKISDQRGIVHNIFDDKLYIELADSNCMAVISAKSVVFAGDGQKLQITDDSSVVVGSFVQVIENEATLRELQGDHFRHGMEETCGKTGRVIRIKQGLQVQFAWGPRFYYQPNALIASSDDKTETRDSTGNWLTNGCPVRLISDPADFYSRQEEIGLPYSGSYQRLVGKFAQLGRVKIKPFSVQKIASVTWKGEEFNVNAEAISLVTSVVDCTGTEIYEGDAVMLRKDASSVLKSLQIPEFGGWTDDMMKCVKMVGIIKEFRVDGRYEALGSMVKVDFSQGISFYFNPKALILYDEEEEGQKTLVHENQSLGKEEKVKNSNLLDPNDETPYRSKKEVKTTKVTLENIDRDNITCSDKLGEGGFGSVYKGTWTLEDGTKRTVAIKQMKYGVTSSNTYEDILKEAKIQFTLNHPNIVSLFGISYATEEQQLWLVMKLVQGRDLLSILFPPKGAPKTGLSFKHKVKICLDISYAIAYIHDRGYLHADIKPQNMMVDEKNGNVYICDFGITRYLGTMDLQAYATRFTNSFGGTLLYVAPECLKQDKKGRYLRPTYKSDVWSLGASFFEIFTEKHLFDDPMMCFRCKSMNDSEYVQKHVYVFAPKEVRRIIQKTLEFSPSRRPHAYELTEVFHGL